jgi:site-specific recombinase XerD
VDWLFESSATPHLFGRARDFYKPFSDLMEEMGIEGHPHMLRHSRATHMLQDGESLFKVSMLLGDNAATVEKVYAHPSVEFMATVSGVEGAGMGL